MGVIRVYPATTDMLSHYLQIKVGPSPISSIKIIKGLLCEYCVVTSKNEKYINIYRIDGLYQKNADDSIASPAKVMASIANNGEVQDSQMCYEVMEEPITKIHHLYSHPWMKSSKELTNYWPIKDFQGRPDISYKIQWVLPPSSKDFRAIICGESIAYLVERFLCIYNLYSHSRIYLSGHTSLIKAIAFSEYNNHIASGGCAEVIIWDAIHYIIIHKIKLPNAKNQIKQIEFSCPTHCLIVLAELPAMIYIYSEFYGAVLYSMNFDTAGVYGICTNQEYCFIHGDKWVGSLRIDDKYTVYKQTPNSHGCILSIAPMENGVVLGTQAGALIRYNAWEDTKSLASSFQGSIKNISYSNIGKYTFH